jgi:DNA modification methylase
MVTRILVGDALTMLRGLESESVQCVVTSPPYFGLRCYGTEPQVWGGDPDHDHDWSVVPSPGSRSSDTKPGPLQHPGNKNRERLTSDLCPCGAWRGELGLEPTPGLFVAHLLMIFREVKRVLRSDGICFVNLSDSYVSNSKGAGQENTFRPSISRVQGCYSGRAGGLKPKSLMLVPQRFAIAMQDDGWIVRSQIAWCKTSAMPESVRDRPTSAWEPIWMFSKSRSYFYDADAVRQPAAIRTLTETRTPHSAAAGWSGSPNANGAKGHPMPTPGGGANLRNYWLLGPQPSSLEHYAGFPPELPKRCILAGSRRGDTVLDPFLGSGTTLMVASRLGRDGIGIELKPEYATMAEGKIQRDAGALFPEDVQVTATRQPSLFDEQEAV